MFSLLDSCFLPGIPSSNVMGRSPCLLLVNNPTLGGCSLCHPIRSYLPLSCSAAFILYNNFEVWRYNVYAQNLVSITYVKALSSGIMFMFLCYYLEPQSKCLIYSTHFKMIKYREQWEKRPEFKSSINKAIKGRSVVDKNHEIQHHVYFCQMFPYHL